MLGGANIKGFDEVMKNLNIELEKIKVKSAAGLIKATIVIRNDTEKTTPITPVDTGNLRSSWFVASLKRPSTDVYNKAFKGKKKDDMAKEHSATIAEAVGMVQAYIKKGVLVVFGYSANYAAAVHEKLGANFQRPGAGPKWFESAIKRNTSKIVGIIANETKIK
jgi:hypothetical protein